LQSKAKTYVPKTTQDVLDDLHPGDLMLIGARPGLGKTNLSLRLLLLATKFDRRCFFFSLEYTLDDVLPKLIELDPTFEQHQSLLTLDFSDAISADYIIDQTQDMVVEGSLIAIDYLQLLDQQRNKPPLQRQIERLKSYAREKRCTLIFISQIDRAYDQSARAHPGFADVRLPNPLDLGLFNKSIFVQN
jgi:replicative DNA helicase